MNRWLFFLPAWITALICKWSYWQVAGNLKKKQNPHTHSEKLSLTSVIHFLWILQSLTLILVAPRLIPSEFNFLCFFSRILNKVWFDTVQESTSYYRASVPRFINSLSIVAFSLFLHLLYISFNLTPLLLFTPPSSHAHFSLYQSVPLFAISLSSYISLLSLPPTQSISIQCISSFLSGVERGGSRESTRGRWALLYQSVPSARLAS